MLGFPRTFSSGIGFQKKLRTRRFFLVLWLVDVVAGGGGGGGAPGSGGGRGGGGGASCLDLLGASLRDSGLMCVCPDIEDGSEVVMEDEVVQLLPSLLQLSGSLVADGQLITSITRISIQHMCSMLRVKSVFPFFFFLMIAKELISFLISTLIHSEEHVCPLIWSQ